ncbi:MAG: OmpH family outer membrane protein [Rhodobacteraceae bacterium]|nr:OmpH family outer membrane protein [Paracoccaceae bacterium]
MIQLIQRVFLGCVLGLGLSSFPIYSQTQNSDRNLYLPVLPSVVVINTDLIYTNSNYGQRVSRQAARVLSDLKIENEVKSAQLAQEEEQLVNMKQEPDFKELAKKFDDKAARVRLEQDQKEFLINSWNATEQAVFNQILFQFMNQLTQIMDFQLVLTHDSVFWHSELLDISDILVSFMNEQIGDGTELESYADPWEIADIEKTSIAQ